MVIGCALWRGLSAKKCCAYSRSFVGKGALAVRSVPNLQTTLREVYPQVIVDNKRAMDVERLSIYQSTFGLE